MEILHDRGDADCVASVAASGDPEPNGPVRTVHPVDDAALGQRPREPVDHVAGDAGGDSSGLRTSGAGRALCRVAASQRSESP
jgi:hypothetical protein